MKSRASKVISNFGESEKEVNYTVKSILHFPDGVNKGQLKVRATDAKDAEAKAREKLKATWDKTGNLKKIEIVSIKKG